MIVLFRSCEANLSAGSLGDGTANKPRWNGKLKLEIIRKCYLSIQSGLTREDSIIIVNDRTTEDTLDWMEKNTFAKFSIVNIRPLSELIKEHPYPTYHPVIANSCTDLTDLIIKVAEDNPKEIIYICEDDYLHTPNAIFDMKQVFYSNYNGFYVPYDYPDRYTIDPNKNCQVHLTPIGHVRSIPSATLTMAAKGETFLKYKYDILRAGAFADDGWTWKAFANTIAICPIPGHATHLQDGCITPIVDWEVIYDSYIL